MTRATSSSAQANGFRFATAFRAHVHQPCASRLPKGRNILISRRHLPLLRSVYDENLRDFQKPEQSAEVYNETCSKRLFIMSCEVRNIGVWQFHHLQYASHNTHPHLGMNFHLPLFRVLRPGLCLPVFIVPETGGTYIALSLITKRASP